MRLSHRPVVLRQLQYVLSAEQNVDPTTNGKEEFTLRLRNFTANHADLENVPHHSVRKEELTIRLRNLATSISSASIWRNLIIQIILSAFEHSTNS